MRIAVLMGGNSSEREVSLESGKAISEALKLKGHEVKEIDYADDLERVLENLSSFAPEKVFLGLHGGSGENGGIQALLDIVGIPYTGSGPLASAMAMDKSISKKLFADEGIQTPSAFTIELTNSTESFKCFKEERFARKINFPCVIKPNDQGSTIGFHLVNRLDQVPEVLKEMEKYGQYALVEEYIPGRDLTVAILEEFPLPVVEIKPKHKVYDYHCKYTEGMSQYFVPANITEEVEFSIKEQAIKAFRVLRCRTYARVDFRFNPEKGLFCLELNTLPGMTPKSLLPKASKASGIKFPELVEKILKDACCRGS